MKKPMHWLYWQKKDYKINLKGDIEMTIEEIKNEVLGNIKEFVTDKAKNIAMSWLKNTALPYVKEVAAAFIAELKNLAANETGWVKFRDLIFLPMLIGGGIWIIEKVLNMLVVDEEVEH